MGGGLLLGLEAGIGLTSPGEGIFIHADRGRGCRGHGFREGGGEGGP
jgi:hypothetical protein